MFKLSLLCCISLLICPTEVLGHPATSLWTAASSSSKASTSAKVANLSPAFVRRPQRQNVSKRFLTAPIQKISELKNKKKSTFSQKNTFFHSVLSREGYTGDECKANVSICKSPRLCLEVTWDECTVASSICYCIDQNAGTCNSSKDCVKGERCEKCEDDLQMCYSCEADLDGNEHIDDGNGNCASTTKGSSPSSSCISVDALSDIKNEDMVFSTHAQATVLCDEQNNCATPGHIVVWKNIPMMMKTYCSSMKCRRSVKLVNSPRMKQGLRVTSNHPDFHYTALSARFETVVEEHVLRGLILIGM